MTTTPPTVWPDRVTFYEHKGDTTSITTVYTATQHPRVLSYLQQNDLRDRPPVPRSLFIDEAVDFINRAFVLQRVDRSYTLLTDTPLEPQPEPN